MQPYSEKALLEAVQELTAIESTADNPIGLGAAYTYMLEMVRAGQSDITIEEFESNGRPSFLAYRGPKRPDTFHIILNAHVDVVPGKSGQYEPVIKNGALYARGAYDMKAAAIVLAQVFCEYVNKVPYALGLQIVTDEELGGSDGTGYQVEQGVRADFVICGECGRKPGDYHIANETKGVLLADIELLGKTCHGAYPWRGDNAATRCARFVQALHEAYPSPQTEHDGTTVTVTGISSVAAAHNQVPEYGLVKLDCRFTADDPHFRSKEAVVSFIQSLDPSAVITAFHTFSMPMRADPQNPLLQELKAAAEAVEGQAFSFVRRHGGSDGRYYLPVGGQACEFGIAGANQHDADEYITLDGFSRYLATMRAFLQKTIVAEEEFAQSEAYAA